MATGQTARIEQIVSQVRSRIESRSSGIVNGDAAPTNTKTILLKARAEILRYRDAMSRAAEKISEHRAALARSDDEVAAFAEKIGSCPPAPETLRGRIGAFFIRILSRLLWWQTFHIRECVRAMVSRNREEAAALDDLLQLVTMTPSYNREQPALFDTVAETVADCLQTVGKSFDRLESDATAPSPDGLSR
jgi:hypothetical protein